MLDLSFVGQVERLYEPRCLDCALTTVLELSQPSVHAEFHFLVMMVLVVVVVTAHTKVARMSFPSILLVEASDSPVIKEWSFDIDWVGRESSMKTECPDVEHCPDTARYRRRPCSERVPTSSQTGAAGMGFPWPISKEIRHEEDQCRWSQRIAGQASATTSTIAASKMIVVGTWTGGNVSRQR